jgi:hypothetical protein
MKTAESENKTLQKILFPSFFKMVISTCLLFLSGCGQPGEIKFEAHSQKASGPNTDQSLPNPDPDKNPPVVINPTPPVILPTPVDPVLAEHSQVYMVRGKTQADILVVIDNSLSMAPEQKNMAERFKDFTQSLSGLDWQLAITTTDVHDSSLSTSDGKMLKFEATNSFLLNSEISPQIAEKAFSETIQRPEAGDGNEQGIKAIYRFLERDLNRAHKLLRMNSTFNVVVVSDSDETPPDGLSGKPVFGPKNDPYQLMNFIHQKWPDKKMQFHSIVVRSGDMACLNQSGNEAYGTYYEALSAATHGVIGNVCETDYSDQLKILGEKVKDLVKIIPLECKPVGDLVALDNEGNSLGISSIEGLNVIFKDYLPMGKVSLKYFCQK